MKKTTMQLMEELGLHEGGVENWIPNNAWEALADLIRADERARLEKAVRELAPLKDIAILQDKPAAFWIEAFAKIVRGEA